MRHCVCQIFILDVVITFFLPYRESQRKGGQMVYDNKKIARAYLRSWFFIDVFTCAAARRSSRSTRNVPPQGFHRRPSPPLNAPRYCCWNARRCIPLDSIFFIIADANNWEGNSKLFRLMRNSRPSLNIVVHCAGRVRVTPAPRARHYVRTRLRIDALSS